MKHGSLFSGIGGFDLAAEWMGWENVFQVEIDDYCQKVLAKNFPNVKRYGDIKEFKGEKHSVDILTGGFPCQPFSHAGKRKGESDDRYLWPEYLRIIREIQPAYVVGENVAGLTSMDDGKALDRILLDLEGEGYVTEQFIIPACGVGAWHRRDRIWIVAYTEGCGDRRGLRQVYGEEGERPRPKEQYEDDAQQPDNASEALPPTLSKRNQPNTPCANPNSIRTYTKEINSTKTRINAQRGAEGLGEDVSDTDSLRRKGGENREESKKMPQPNDKQFERYSKLHRTNGAYWTSEPNVGRVANGVSRRVDRLKGLGNAIVPQVAYEIFKAIDKINETNRYA